jgi:hypothetical protein
MYFGLCWFGMTLCLVCVCACVRIDASNEFHYGKYVVDSPSPNVRLEKVKFENGSARICLRSIADIEVDDELLLDYRSTDHLSRNVTLE